MYDCPKVGAKRCLLVLSGVDVAAAIQDLPSFVSSFDYSLTGQMFLLQPAAAGRTAHLGTLSVQHAAQALQTHGVPLMQQAQQSVCEFVMAQLQELGRLMAQQEVQIVLEAASAAVRASAAAERQAPNGSPRAATVHPAQHARREVLEQERIRVHDKIGMFGENEGLVNGTDHLQTDWLTSLRAEHLVDFADMLQTGLQEQQLPDCRQTCMDHIYEVVSGQYHVPCRAVLCCAVLCCAVLCCAVLCCAVLCCAYYGLHAASQMLKIKCSLCSVSY